MCQNISEIVSTFFANVPAYDRAGIVEKGWSYEPETVKPFVEPGISLKEGPLAQSNIWLFTAPGAVGKSTYAKELGNAARAIYLDLSIAHRIGGYYLTGGIIYNGLGAHMNDMAIVIDSLDEAFLGNNDATRISFFDDIVRVAKANRYPLILFGRPGAIVMAQLILAEANYTPALVGLEYFSRPQAVELVYKMTETRIRRIMENPNTRLAPGDLTLEKLTDHREAAERFVGKILDSLENVASDPDFIGYAPVLDAVADYLRTRPNFGKIALAEQFTAELGLEGICQAILDREREKVFQKLNLPLADYPHIYTREEQMEALCSVYLGKHAEDFVFRTDGLTPAQQQGYQDIAREFLAQHPFLLDSIKPTNAVFEGAIQSFILKRLPKEESANAKWQASPLLAQFYFNDDAIYAPGKPKRQESSEIPQVKAAHIPFLVESYVALANQGQYVAVEILKDEDLDVEITMVDEGNNEGNVLKKFTSPYEGELVFRQQGVSWYIDDLAENDDAPQGDGDDAPRQPLDVKFATLGAFTLRTPVYVNVHSLNLDCAEINILGNEGAVLEAEKCQTQVTNLIGNVGQVYAEFPGSLAYPWNKTNRLQKNAPALSANVKKAFFSFCKIIRIFRTHKFGSLAKDEAKIDSRRVRKNFGREITQKLIEQKVLKHEAKNHKYILNPDTLGDVTDMSFQRVRQREMSETLLRLLKEIVGER